MSPSAGVQPVTVAAADGSPQAAGPVVRAPSRGPSGRPAAHTLASAVDVFPGLAGRAVPWAVTVAVLMLMAFGVRLWFMTRGGGLLSVGGYDDGVYYAAAASLLHGRAPYRDFLFLQPPGIVFATVPFAWLGGVTSDTTGFLAGRIGFMLVGAVNTGLIAVILRRYGHAAVTVAGVFYAVGYIAVYGERSILLEPIGNLGILVALAILSRRRLRVRPGWVLAAGIALGVAVGFKIWYLVPAVIIVAFCHRRWLRLVIGGAVGAGVIYLPLFIVDPAGMWRQVVLDQLGRKRVGGGVPDRIRVMLGGQTVPAVLKHLGVSTGMLAAVVVLAAAVAVVAAWTVRDARLYVCLFVADAVVLLVSPPFLAHYGALTMPMLALVVGAGFHRLTRRLDGRRGRAVAAAAVIVALVGLNAHNLADGMGQRVPENVRAAVADVHGCVMTDGPEILAISNVLGRQLRDGCPLWPDVTGWTYDTYRSPHARANNPAWQRAALTYLTSGAAVIMVRPHSTLSDASLAELARRPVLHRDGPWVLYATGATPPAAR